MILLDTHVWVWLFEGEMRRIGRRARQRFIKAERQDSVRISPASMFEVAALQTAGRLRLAVSPERWIRDALDRPGVRLVELTPAVAIDAGSIPRTALADPVDRLLVATARQLGVAFLTRDARILDYASRTGDVQVHDASL